MSGTFIRQNITPLNRTTLLMKEARPLTQPATWQNAHLQRTTTASSRRLDTFSSFHSGLPPSSDTGQARRKNKNARTLTHAPAHQKRGFITVVQYARDASASTPPKRQSGKRPKAREISLALFFSVPPHNPRSDVMATMRFFWGQPEVSIPSSVTCGGSLISFVHSCKDPVIFTKGDVGTDKRRAKTVLYVCGMRWRISPYFAGRSYFFVRRSVLHVVERCTRSCDQGTT